MNQLAYIEPRTFRKLSEASDWRLPEDLSINDEGRWLRIRGMSKLMDMSKRSRQFANKNGGYLITPPFDRSLAAWYLNAAGFTFKEIGDLFEISATSASAAVRKIRNQAYRTQPESVFSKKAAKLHLSKFFLTVSKEVRLAHLVTQSYREMRDVECVMNNIYGDHAVRSSALKVGESKFLLRRQTVGDYRCLCVDCKQFKLPELLGNSAAEAAD